MPERRCMLYLLIARLGEVFNNSRRMNQQKYQFRLDVRIENQSPMKIDVIDTVTAGLDPRNDLVLLGKKIKTKHLFFEVKGENLALHYLGNTNQTFLNSLPLEEGKTYLLDPGDLIELSSAEIIICHELVFIHETQKVKKVIFNKELDKTSESVKESPIYAGIPTGPINKKPYKNIDKPNLLSLWMIKIYALITDIFFTYLLLILALPLLQIDSEVNTIVLKLASWIFPEGHHSFLSFLIAWYLLSFAQTMIIGTTIGQFLLGLKTVSSNTFGKLILYRFKTFFYSLILLPAQNTVRNNFVFKSIRRVGIVIIFIFVLFSPFLLPSPYNTPLAVITPSDSAKKELNTKSISSYSKELGLELKSELPYRYFLMPAIIENPGKRSFEIFDLKTNHSITIVEAESFSYKKIEAQLEYANPLYSSLHKTSLTDLPLASKKQVIENALLLSPIHLPKSIATLGPFLGSGLLLKKILLDGNTNSDIVINTYLSETPLLFISSSQQDFFYLFGPTHLLRFVVNAKNRADLVSVFTKEVFTKLNVEPHSTETLKNQRVSLLQAQEAIIHGDEQTFLTYYINEANTLSNTKLLDANMDFSENAKLALTKNIESVQKFIKNKNVYKSFNDIKIQLTPMEKPGVKR